MPEIGVLGHRLHVQGIPPLLHHLHADICETNLGAGMMDEFFQGKAVHPEGGPGLIYPGAVLKVFPDKVREQHSGGLSGEMWIKQNLKIKAFYGTSKNAVLIQSSICQRRR